MHVNSNNGRRILQHTGPETEQKPDGNGPATVADTRQTDTEDTNKDHPHITVFMRKHDDQKDKDDHYDMEAYDLQGHLYCSVESDSPGIPIELEAPGPKNGKEREPTELHSCAEQRKTPTVDALSWQPTTHGKAILED